MQIRAAAFLRNFAAMCSNFERLVFSCIELEPSIHPSNLSSEWHGTFPTFLPDSSSCTACGWAARWCLEAGRQREPSAGALVFALRGRSAHRSTPGYFPLFRIHIRKIAVGFKSKIRPLRTRLVTLKCILSHRDRGRSSRERGLQASPRPFLGLFLGLFFFLSFVPTPCSESGPRASSPL